MNHKQRNKYISMNEVNVQDKRINDKTEIVNNVFYQYWIKKQFGEEYMIT